MAWRFNACDKGGPFAWTRLDNPVEFKEVIDALTSMETLSESDLAKRKCHFISIENFSAEAKNRLIEIKEDDLDELYSFWIAGSKRVFAIHRGHYTRILWYDPEHKVCPSPKKHT